jgi:hypothetical protein
MSEFIPGLLLAERFFHEVVHPLIQETYPYLEFDAALLGPGSEVLGYDDEISIDHHWGPRTLLFLSEEDFIAYGGEIKRFLGENLPYTFLGYSTNWSEPDPEDSMTQLLTPKTIGAINHRVEIYTVRSYLEKFLGIKRTNLSEYDWLTLSEQRLLEFTSGKVFYNGLGDLKHAREHLGYFPENVWKFKLLAEWEHIGQEIAFVGRPAAFGDELGSRIETGRLVRHIMRIGYMLSKKYVPYPKWFGRGFSDLPIARDLHLLLLNILKENFWRSREEMLCKAYLILLEKMITLRIVPKIVVEPISFHNRDQLVIDTDKICQEIKKTIKEPLSEVQHPLGSIDHFIDQTDILTTAKLSRKTISFFLNK